MLTGASRTDQTGATITGLQPKFPPMHIPKESLQTLMSHAGNFHLDDLPPGLRKLVNSGKVSQKLTELIKQICIISSCTSTIEPTDDIRPSLVNARICLTYRVLTLSKRSEAEEGMIQLNKDFEECIRVVALIYTNWALLLIPGYYVIHEQLACQLRNALSRTDLDLDWIGYEDLLLWTLFVGSAVCPGTKIRGWFVGSAARVAKKMSLQCWKEAKTVLTMFLYNAKICEKPWELIWMDATAIGVPELEE